jgi:hypothetical protein
LSAEEEQARLRAAAAAAGAGGESSSAPAAAAAATSSAAGTGVVAGQQQTPRWKLRRKTRRRSWHKHLAMSEQEAGEAGGDVEMGEEDISEEEAIERAIAMSMAAGDKGPNEEDDDEDMQPAR